MNMEGKRNGEGTLGINSLGLDGTHITYAGGQGWAPRARGQSPGRAPLPSDNYTVGRGSYILRLTQETGRSAESTKAQMDE